VFSVEDSGVLDFDREVRRIEMRPDRRRSERRHCGGLAKIQFGIGSLPRDCTITDVSDGGARIIAENLDVPAEFTLIFSTGSPRQCRLVWRIGCEFGAEFIDGLDARQFGKRLAGAGEAASTSAR
jgi:hypothetical protein